MSPCSRSARCIDAEGAVSREVQRAVTSSSPVSTTLSLLDAAGGVAVDPVPPSRAGRRG
jgi:hypothetical protein